MKVKKTCMFFLAALFLITTVSAGLAQDKKKKKKGSGAPTQQVEGQIILHKDKMDVKVLKEDFTTITILYDKGTRFEVLARASDADLGQEERPPSGTVTYYMKDGKPVATKISYSPRANWGIKKKKKK